MIEFVTRNWMACVGFLCGTVNISLALYYRRCERKEQPIPHWLPPTVYVVGGIAAIVIVLLAHKLITGGV